MSPHGRVFSSGSSHWESSGRSSPHRQPVEGSSWRSFWFSYSSVSDSWDAWHPSEQPAIGKQRGGVNASTISSRLDLPCTTTMTRTAVFRLRMLRTRTVGPSIVGEYSCYRSWNKSRCMRSSISTSPGTAPTTWHCSRNGRSRATDALLIEKANRPKRTTR